MSFASVWNRLVAGANNQRVHYETPKLTSKRRRRRLRGKGLRSSVLEGGYVTGEALDLIMQKDSFRDPA